MHVPSRCPLLGAEEQEVQGLTRGIVRAGDGYVDSGKGFCDKNKDIVEQGESAARARGIPVESVCIHVVNTSTLTRFAGSRK